MRTEKSDVELESKVLYCLHKIAPEFDLKNLKREVSLRDQVDIDSLDFVRFVVLLHETLGVDVPEIDYSKLATFESCISFLKLKLKDQIHQIDM